MIFRSRAPLRISFAGGGTDVSPYPETHGGCVLNVAINKYAYTSIEMIPQKTIEVESLDYDVIAHFRSDEPLALNGDMDLVKATISRLKECQSGLRVFIHNDAPPGSGLGSSSAMVVSLIGAFREWRSLTLSDYEIARLAYQIERDDLGIAGGKQDQYACTFGGFNFIEFNRDSVIVNPLRIKPVFLHELQYNMLLCYTGRNRVSGHIIESQINNFVQGRQKSIDAMHEIKLQASDMKNALVTGNTRAFGELLNHAWEAKKRMADEISNPMIDEMYEAAIRAGAIGGKVSGAGGGGFMMFYCENGKRHRVAECLERLGGKVVDFQFELHGLQTWRATNVNRGMHSASESVSLGAAV